MPSLLAAANPASHTSLTLLEIGVVFLGLGILAWLALKLKISSVPLFLLAGLALGKGGIAPLDLSEEFLNVGAEIGAILLLLVLGFEYSANEIAATMRKRWSAGVVDFVLNAIPGAVLAFALGYGWIGALAYSGIMFVSSSGIASQMLRESGWARSNVAKRSTGVLVLEDLLLAPYLPLVASLTLGLGVWAGVVSVGIALLVMVAVFFVADSRESKRLKRLANRGPGVLLLLVFGFTLTVAGAANLVGFSGAVAVFLVGLLLNGEVAELLRSRFAPLREIFSAVFFLIFGLSISALDVLAALPIAAAFAAIGILGKFGLGWWLGRDLSDPISWRRIGAFLTPRGEFSMIIATTVAVDSSLKGVKEITIGIVILTTVFATITLRSMRSVFDR